MKHPPKPAPVPVPEFTSDRMRLLAPLITARVTELAHHRMRGTKLVSGKGVHEPLAVDDEPWVIKLALLIVLEMNPFERFTVEEEGLMRGMDADNVNKHKSAGLIRSF